MYQQTFRTSVSILKRIWREYIQKYKNTYYIVIVLMVIGQGLLLASPLVTSIILDDHLKGITNEPWYQVDEEDKHTVYFNGSLYKQAHYFSKDDIKGEPLTILSIDDAGGYYAIKEEIEVSDNAKYSLDGDTLTITDGNQEIVVEDVLKLTKKDVRAFYGPIRQSLIIFLVILFVVSIASVIIRRYQRLLIRSMNVKIVRDARKDAVRKLQHISMEYYEQEPAGKMANRILFDVNGIAQLIESIFHITLNAILALIAAYLGMFIIEWKIALVMLILIPILVLWARSFMYKMRESAREVNEYYSRVADGLNRLINAIPLLQIFNYRKRSVEKFNETNKAYMDEYLHEVKLHMSQGGNLLELFSSLVIAGLILFFGWGGMKIGGIVVTAGMINAFIQYLPRVIEPFYF